MPGQLFIDRELNFRNTIHRWNVSGPQQERKRHQWDRFAWISTSPPTDIWGQVNNGTADTIEMSEVQGGSALFTTGTVDNDSQMMSGAVIYSADKLAIVEWRLTITDVSGTGVFVGFSDAKSEINGSIAIHYPDDSVTYVATNGVGFVIDADHATSSIMCCGVKAGTGTTPVDTAIDWADGETKTLRVELDADGGAFYYVDGVGYAYIANSVTDSTLLCCTVQAMTRADDGANTVRVRSFDAWQDD